MKYSSGPQVPTMPKDGPDSVEVRSRAGDARQFSPSAARNCGPIREVLTRVLPKKGNEHPALKQRGTGQCDQRPFRVRKTISAAILPQEL